VNLSRDETLSRHQISGFSRVHELAQQFDVAWQGFLQGSKPRPLIEDYLKATDLQQTTLLHELLAIELERRADIAERPGLAEYWQRFPENKDLISLVFRDLDPNCLTDRKCQKMQTLNIIDPEAFWPDGLYDFCLEVGFTSD
jgi:hypothetical protein